MGRRDDSQALARVLSGKREGWFFRFFLTLHVLSLPEYAFLSFSMIIEVGRSESGAVVWDLFVGFACETYTIWVLSWMSMYA